jgi:methionyl aminopeptidase
VLCTSINEVVVHGIPRKDESSRTATSSASTSASSSTGSAPIPPGRSGRQRLEEKQKLVATPARRSSGDRCARPGKRLGDLGHAIQSYAESRAIRGRQFVGHGTGRQMHEDPQVPNFGEAGSGKRMKSGLVIAVEPMVNAGPLR